MKRALKAIELEEAYEEFKQFPGETVEEFFAARELHLKDIETFGDPFHQLFTYCVSN